jgi:hypothetical protein
MHNSHPQEKCKHMLLDYCEKCNIVFCKICKEEWKKESITYNTDTQPNVTWNPTPNIINDGMMLLNNDCTYNI